MKSKLKYFIFSFLLLFIMCGKVHAETFDVTNNTTMAGYNFPAWWAITGTRNLVFKYQDWQYLSQTETIQANFGYLDTCATANFTVNNNNADCGDGCFSNNFNVVNTGRSCTIIYDGSGTTSGRQYLIFYSVKEWGWTNTDTLPIVYDTLTFSGSSTIQFYGNYLANEDLYLEFASTNRLNDLLEQQQAIQEETNDKLDEQISQNETIIDQNQDIIDNQEATNDKLDNQIQQDKEQHEESQATRTGMWATLKSMLNFINPLSNDFFAYKLVELLLNMLKSLFIPEDMDFVTNFVDALESKLGFIAAIPVKIIEFTMSLATATWSEFNSIQLPSISIFGYNFWNAQEIDLTEAINIFKPFKYVTDCICVVICAQTLNKWRERFTGGSK